MQPDEPANINPESAAVWFVCTDCEYVFQAFLCRTRLAPKPCRCGGKRVPLRELQRLAKLGQLMAVPDTDIPYEDGSWNDPSF
jgi:hypothetical protein